MTNKAMPKKPVKKDWHPAEIIAAIHKQGLSLAQLGFAHGYKNRGSLTQALYKPYPAAEAIIAMQLGLAPEVIWPSRYNADGTSNRVKGRKPMRSAEIARIKLNTPANSGNPHARKAA